MKDLGSFLNSPIVMKDSFSNSLSKSFGSTGGKFLFLYSYSTLNTTSFLEDAQPPIISDINLDIIIINLVIILEINIYFAFGVLGSFGVLSLPKMFFFYETM